MYYEKTNSSKMFMTTGFRPIWKVVFVPWLYSPEVSQSVSQSVSWWSAIDNLLAHTVAST